ncbi:MAG: DUF72 domain-containing protein [Bacteroidota bacterium]
MLHDTLHRLRAQVDAYDFRDLHPHLRVGTASDRYAGWLGQIYPAERAPQVTERPRKLGGQSFTERMLPVASVADYFDHFEVLELDFTYYRPLLEPNDEPGPSLFVLQQYATHAPAEARFLLKAPQTYFARTLRRSRGGQVTYEDNPDFLNADAYRRRFHEPAQATLGNRLGGVIFEQAYQRVRDSPAPEDNIAELDAFFQALPEEVPFHVELRSEHLLVPPYFAWLESRGLGFVFSHWTWLPALRDQWRLCGGRFSSGAREVVARLLTPRHLKYAQAYAQAYPFDKPIETITGSADGRRMVLDTVALLYRAAEAEVVLNVIANNRAWGNAPDLARVIAHRMLDEEVKRSAG